MTYQIREEDGKEVCFITIYGSGADIAPLLEPSIPGITEGVDPQEVEYGKALIQRASMQVILKISEPLTDRQKALLAKTFESEGS